MKLLISKQTWQNFNSTQMKEMMLSIKGVSCFIKKNFKKMFYTLLNIKRKFFSDKGVARKTLTLFKKWFSQPIFNLIVFKMSEKLLTWKITGTFYVISKNPEREASLIHNDTLCNIWRETTTKNNHFSARNIKISHSSLINWRFTGYCFIPSIYRSSLEITYTVPLWY